MSLNLMKYAELTPREYELAKDLSEDEEISNSELIKLAYTCQKNYRETGNDGMRMRAAFAALTSREVGHFK